MVSDTEQSGSDYIFEEKLESERAGTIWNTWSTVRRRLRCHYCDCLCLPVSLHVSLLTLKWSRGVTQPGYINRSTVTQILGFLQAQSCTVIKQLWRMMRSRASALPKGTQTESFCISQSVIHTEWTWESYWRDNIFCSAWRPFKCTDTSRYLYVTSAVRAPNQNTTAKQPPG